MAETTIGNLTLGAVDGTSLFEQERTDNGSQVSEKVLSSSVANFVGNSHQFAGLNTTAKNLVGAINEAASMGGVVQLTQAEYTALTTAEKMNGSIYKLTDKAIFYCLDEEYHAVKELTTAEYEALTTAQKNNGTIYIQTDAETTGSDIPVSTGETETIAEAIAGVSSISRYSASSVYGNFSCKAINGIKCIKFNDPRGLSANSLTTLDFTLPESMRPIEEIRYFDIRQPSDNYTIRLSIHPDGMVQIYNYGSNTGVLNMALTGCYI